MENYNYTVVENEVISDEDIVLTINDWYSNSDECNYVMPVAESESLNYVISKEMPVENKFYEVRYNV